MPVEITVENPTRRLVRAAGSVQAEVRADHPQAVRPEEADASASRAQPQLGLQGAPCLTAVPEASRDHDRSPDAHCAALGDHIGHSQRRGRDYREVRRRSRQVANARPGCKTGDLGVAGIDVPDLALEPGAIEVLAQDITERTGHIARPNEHDRPGTENSSKTVFGHNSALREQIRAHAC
jgi:hypothetical protein